MANDERIEAPNIAVPEAVLDLTREPWNLPYGTHLSDSWGLDIIRPGGIRTMKPMRSVGISALSVGGGGIGIPTININTAEPIGWDSRAAVVYRGRYIHPGFDTNGYHRADDGALDLATWSYDEAGHAGGEANVLYNNTAFAHTAAGITRQTKEGCCLHVYSPTARAGAYVVDGQTPSSDSTGTGSGDAWMSLDSAMGSGDGSQAEGNLKAICHWKPGYVQGNYAMSADVSPYNFLMKNQLLHDIEGGWSTDLVGKIMYFDESEAWGGSDDYDNLRLRITGVVTVHNSNDTLTFEKVDGTLMTSAISSGTTFYVVRDNLYEKSGVWLSNGYQFWLVSNGTVTHYFSLENNDRLGESWSIARISNSRIMFVNPNHEPLIMHISESAQGEAPTRAGLFAPEWYESIEVDPTAGGTAQFPHSWQCKTQDFSGNMPEDAEFRCKVRGVNLELGMASEFVDVFSETGRLDINSSGTAGGNVASARIYTSGVSDDPASDPMMPPYDPRYTHLEIWRTVAANASQTGFDPDDLPGLPYYLETRVELPRYFREDVPDDVTSGASGGDQDYWDSTGGPDWNIGLSNADLMNRPIATEEDYNGNGVPPVCKAVVSLLGVTICAGKAEISDPKRTVYTRTFFSQGSNDASLSVAGSTGTLTNTGAFADYNLRAGDQYVFVHAEREASLAGGADNLYEEAFDITAKTDDTLTLDMDSSAWDTASATDVRGYIRRPNEIDLPAVETDEEIWFSRTDQFLPESFPRRSVRLSSIGDTFKAMKLLGNYAIVVMLNGVHILYFEGNTLNKDTVENNSSGTPWANSVVPYKKRLLWATPDGINVLSISNSPDINGHRGKVMPLSEDGRFRGWFRDAYDNGYEIDAGVDETNGCLRVRKQIGTEEWESLQINLSTGLATKIKHDTGGIFVSSSHVESDATSPRLYSVTTAGEFVDVNYDGTSDPTSGLTMEYEGDGTNVQLTSTSLQVASGYGTGDNAVVGLPIKIVGDDGVAYWRLVSGYLNSGGGYFIQWSETLPAAAYASDGANASVQISDNSFGIKFAPYRGQVPRTVKNLDGVFVHALPGEFAGVGDWPDPPTGKLNVRVYRNYDETQTGDDYEVSIFDEDDASYTSDDRFAEVFADGHALELEIEIDSPRTSMRIEAIEPIFRDSYDVAVDRKDDE
jgi:hypothetical protein